MTSRWSPHLGPVVLTIVGIAATVATLAAMGELASIATPAERSFLVRYAWGVGLLGSLSALGAVIAIVARRYGLAKVIGAAPALWCAQLLICMQRGFRGFW